jgi:hypothetical protein
MEMNTNIVQGIKDNLLSFILTAVAVVFGLVGLIAYSITNSIAGYAVSGGATAMVIIAFIALLIDLACIIFFGADNKISAILGILAIVLTLVALGMVISSRILTIAAVFSYDSGNMVAWSAVKSAIVAIIGLLLTSIITVVSGFFANKK